MSYMEWFEIPHMDEGFGLVFIDDDPSNELIYDDLFKQKEKDSEGKETDKYEGGTRTQIFSYLHYNEKGFFHAAL